MLLTQSLREVRAPHQLFPLRAPQLAQPAHRRQVDQLPLVVLVHPRTFAPIFCRYRHRTAPALVLALALAPVIVIVTPTALLLVLLVLLTVLLSSSQQAGGTHHITDSEVTDRISLRP
eukprot:COSAG01_NODE_11317_length_1960_cov_2.421279_1_plen_118_part_00